MKHIPLTVAGLNKRFGEFEAVKGLDLSVNPGEVLGIVGPNGAGKTTTIKCILGLLIPDQGKVELFGQSNTSPEARRRIGYMPETPSFYNYLTGRELLQFVGDLFQVPKQERDARADSLLEKVGLTEARNRQLHGYSKGMLQRIGLAQALMNKPELLFLDEPMDGLDPIGRIRMKEVLLDIKKEGTAIVLNSHILSDVAVMSDRIAIMDFGRILTLKPVQDLIPKGKTLEDIFIETIEAKGHL